LTCYLHVDGRRGSDVGPPGLLRSQSTIDASRHGANLREVDLSKANLSEADLSGAYLVRTRLIAADLSGANLRGVRKIAERFGVDPGTVQRISRPRPFAEGAASVVV
jgi:hypothetical protein